MVDGTYIVTIKQRKFGIKRERVIGFKFTMETWMMLSNYTQLAPIDFGLMNPESFIAKTCYCACKLWHLEQGLKLDFDEDKVVKWVEGMTKKEGDELIKTLFASKIAGESLNELIPKAIDKLNEEKKKSAGMKSEIMQ